ncbi:putative acetylornithine aminotransferase [Podospora fimiseda]|uniref:Ornithine aminotransferase n=1 Tax=Podospora fimiseda TaxID=252190 RepID=A0AAN6YQU2_9PEZI|nr:putative acetylornithine aminotransferase [Podospora fimiseda]
MAVCNLTENTKDLLELEGQHTVGGYDPMPAFIVRAQGVKLWDVDGKEYLDFTSMFGAVNQGHSHPTIVGAVIEQMRTASLINSAAHTAIWPAFAKMMCQRFKYDKIVPTVSGTDAVESACKIARKWGIQVKGIAASDVLILGVAGCYHGLSTAMWSLQDSSLKRDAYGIGDEHHLSYNPTTGEPLRYGDVEAMRVCLDRHHARVAAVVLECVRGHLPTAAEEIAYATAVYDMCKSRKILFIADEVRMGCGKTGRFLCCEHLGDSRRPDMVALGKSISGGMYPASYVLGSGECMDLVETKEILSTFSFSPIAVAATSASLRVLDDENLVARARTIEEMVVSETSLWDFWLVDHVTVRGADFGIWLRGVDQGTCRLICELCMQNGLLVFPSPLRIRMSVAMVMTDKELLEGLRILKEALGIVSLRLGSPVSNSPAT